MSNYEMTQQFEGFGEPGRHGMVYKDTKGHPTVGWGFNLNDAFVASMVPKDVQLGRRALTEEEATPIFNALYANALLDARKKVGPMFTHLPQTAQDVFTDMSYNMGGNKFGGFHDMIKAAQQQDWSGVSREMQDSNWYNQVGDRSKNLQTMIQNIGSKPKTAQQPKESFSSAFAAARKQGLSEFEYKGKKYTTKIK